MNATDKEEGKKIRGKLRIVDNYQGKYKKMNSGKYPYKKNFKDGKEEQNHNSTSAKKERKRKSSIKHLKKENEENNNQQYKKYCLKYFPEDFVDSMKKFFCKVNKMNIDRKNRKRKNKQIKENKLVHFDKKRTRIRTSNEFDNFQQETYQNPNHIEHLFYKKNHISASHFNQSFKKYVEFTTQANPSVLKIYMNNIDNSSQNNPIEENTENNMKIDDEQDKNFNFTTDYKSNFFIQDEINEITKNQRNVLEEINKVKIN